MEKHKTKTIVIVVMSIALTVLVTSCSHDGNLYRIQKDGLYGFIDKTGKIVIEPQFEYVGNFSNDGFALIILDASITTVTAKNTTQVRPDTALILTYNYIDKGGETLLSNNEEIVLCNGDSWMLFRDLKDFASRFKSHTLGFTEYVLPELNLNEDRYLFQNDKYLVGYKDKKGNIAIEPRFHYGHSMNKGVIFVQEVFKKDSILRRKDFLRFMKENLNRSRLIDADGDYVSELEMHNFSDFNDWGYAWISVAHIDTTLKTELDWFRIDRTGRVTCGPINAGYRGGVIYNNYRSKEPLYVASFSFGILGTFYSWVDDKGNFLTDYDHSGSLSISFGIDQSELFSDVTTFSDGVAGVNVLNNSESVWFFVDKDINVVSEQYDSVFPFVNGFAAVQEKNSNWPHFGKWGFVGFNTDSSIVQKIPFIFSEVSNFNKDGLAYASVKGTGVIKEGYINKDGEFVWETLRKKTE